MKSAGSLLLLILFLLGCTNRSAEKKQSSGYYFDYTITGQEGNEWVSCRLRYRIGGMDGEAVSIPGGKIQLDGRELLPDSAGFSGIYYGIDLPLDSFTGKHMIGFTEPGGKVYREEFEFRPFSIEELPDRIPRRPFTIRLQGLPSSAILRLVMVDTAFANNDLIRKVKVDNGQLDINQDMINQLSSGPISLEIFHEEERRPRQATMAGGRMYISYRVQRDFDLAD